MSPHARRSGEGTAWLVADGADGEYLCYWYTGRSGDNLEERARVTTATLAVGWARVRTSQVRIRMPDHRTYWAGAAPTPPGFAGTWVEGPRESAKHGLGEDRP